VAPAIAVGAGLCLGQERAREVDEDELTRRAHCPSDPTCQAQKEVNPGPAQFKWRRFSENTLSDSESVHRCFFGIKCVFPAGKRILGKGAICFSVRGQFVRILFTNGSLAEKLSYLFTRSSKSGDSKAHVFVSSSPF
jgi:hypothetical protein